jgi:hypothetical protein
MTLLYFHGGKIWDLAQVLQGTLISLSLLSLSPEVQMSSESAWGRGLMLLSRGTAHRLVSALPFFKVLGRVFLLLFLLAQMV